MYRVAMLNDCEGGVRRRQQARAMAAKNSVDEVATVEEFLDLAAQLHLDA